MTKPGIASLRKPIATREKIRPSRPGIFSGDDMPKIDLSHIMNLTDDTGMIQHALNAMPNRKEGYCIDDNSRALLLMVLACKQGENPTALHLLPTYLSFIHYMQAADGSFKNFMSYAKTSTDEAGSEDSFGRTIMALGYLANDGTSKPAVKTGVEIFLKAYKQVHGLVSLRGIANSIIGICQFVKFNFPDDLKVETVIALSDKLIRGYKDNGGKNWKWFDNILTYDNAILPLALLNAFEVTQNDEYFDTALESMGFLESVVFRDGMLQPVGNQGWFKKGGVCAPFDQQGIDAMAMVLLYQQAFRITKEKKYLLSMYKSYQWFLGVNDAGLSLYDPSTGGCFDGLQQAGVNHNQGAESTIAYWISHFVVLSALKENNVA